MTCFEIVFFFYMHRSLVVRAKGSHAGSSLKFLKYIYTHAQINAMRVDLQKESYHRYNAGQSLLYFFSFFSRLPHPWRPGWKFNQRFIYIYIYTLAIEREEPNAFLRNMYNTTILYMLYNIYVETLTIYRIDVSNFSMRQFLYIPYILQYPPWDIFFISIKIIFHNVDKKND